MFVNAVDEVERVLGENIRKVVKIRVKFG